MNKIALPDNVRIEKLNGIWSLEKVVRDTTQFIGQRKILVRTFKTKKEAMEYFLNYGV